MAFNADYVYSYGVHYQVFTPVPNVSPLALAAIEQKLLAASQAYSQRRYQDAIEAYRQASNLIAAQLDPKFPPEVVVDPATASQRDPRLFDSLLNISAQWLNVLPAAEALAAPRPPAASPDLLGVLARYENTGLTGSAAALGATPAATRAAPAGVAATSVFPPPIVRPAPATPTQTPAQAAAPQIVAVDNRALSLVVDGSITPIAWSAGQMPPVATLRTAYYEARVNATSLSQLNTRASQPSDRALELAHDYYFVIPLGLADCYHALGDYARAETLYIQAAAYRYLNPAIEAPYVWRRLAWLYNDWGDLFFRGDDAATATGYYARIITIGDGEPSSPLYGAPSLKAAADAARSVIAQLGVATTLPVNPDIIAAIFYARGQLAKIKGNLDFLGLSRSTVPIWTFDYLQGVAVNFAQLAMNAEQQLINFWDHADQAQLTRAQISATVGQSRAEVTAASLAADEAAAEVTVYADGVDLANLRVTNANNAVHDYSILSSDWILYQALTQQMAGGENNDIDWINQGADQMLAGRGGFKGGGGAAVASLIASRLNRDYEIGAMERTAAEMTQAAAQASAELDAAKARVTVAQASVAVAQMKALGAQQVLDTFDEQFFTPEVWKRLGDEMLRLYHRYLDMALRVARLMQQAYNFETDQDLALIQTAYAPSGTNGLLGAEALMADIQRFTYELITSSASKPEPLRQTISLAERYGFAFENQLRRTGTMDFETRLEDFDGRYPGTYAGRIESVEVAIEGIVPATGISGALTNSGVSQYRLPTTLSTASNGGVKYRIQPRETLILSDYTVRNDALLLQTDQRMLKLLQGAGVASAWRLELPKSINDLDYGALTDVKVTFYYKARFDADLRARVLQQLWAYPGATGRQRPIPLRWSFPDAFFAFQRTGTLSFSLAKNDFPLNEQAPKLTSLSLIVSAPGFTTPVTLGLGVPGKTSIKAETGADGAARSDAGAPWGPLLGGPAVGDYQITVAAGDNPGLVQNGALALAPIVNVALIIGYTFTLRSGAAP